MKAQGLSARQANIVATCPKTAKEIASDFGISPSTARDHFSNIDEHDHLRVKKRTLDTGEVLYSPEYLSSTPPSPDGTSHKGKKTTSSRKHLMELENRFDDLLAQTEPMDVETPIPSSDTEDVFLHRTDDHIGAYVENERGEVEHDLNLVEEKFKKVTRKTMKVINRHKEAGYSFRGAHLAIGGDVVDGERVYPHQTWEVCATLDEQIDIGARLYLEQIKTLAEEFEFVQVICQQGNHGDFGDRTTSKEANADRLVYDALQRMVRVSDYDNVFFTRNESNTFTNFEMRGHKGHLRHGQNSLAHIGTSASKKRWRGWKLNHNFDIAYWGHYHSEEHDDVMGSKVIRSGSLNPADDFEEGLSEDSRSVVTLHGVSDERPFTWSYPIDLEDYK